jgi:hypothetical protein
MAIGCRKYRDSDFRMGFFGRLQGARLERHRLAADAPQFVEDERRSNSDRRASCKSRSNNPSVKRPIGLAAPEQNCGS